MVALAMCMSVVGCAGMSSVVERQQTFFKMLTLYIWLMIYARTTTNAFNIDKENVIQYHGDPHTMFGFSVAEHREQGRSWVLIGAPQTSDSIVRSDYHGGAVFYCDTEQNDSCRKIPQTSYLKHENDGIFDNNTRQWLGATVQSSGNVILTCAPRYFWYRHNGQSHSNRDPVGTCFVSTKNFADFVEYSPCRNRNYGHAKQSTCEVGFGAAISKDSNRIYLGAVGAYFWQGQLFSVLHTQFRLPYEFVDRLLAYDERSGAAYARSIYHEPTFMVTKEGPKSIDDSYMGYSMASIDFFVEASSKTAGVITGVPRGDELSGKVKLLTWNLIDVKNITGEQFASYFGYSVAVADVDGDGADDVIVGAPMYSDYNPNNMDIERGRVYVYYQTTKNCPLVDRYCWAESKFVKYDYIDGAQSRSRFGLALTSLGDINQDGYDDFAVGAPYEGMTGVCGQPATVTGAVYIYYGSSTGVRKKFSQVITASEMSKTLTTFGFSLAGGLDVDDNTYPDLVVGAYESNTVYLFKSRPVIQLNASISFESSSKMIGLNEVNCRLKNGAPASCVNLDVCMQYRGAGVPDMIDLDVRVTLDVNQPASSSRMFFKDNEELNVWNAVIQVHKGNIICRKMGTFIASLSTNQDKLNHLEAELKYHLLQAPYTRRGILTPVLSMDDDTPLVRRASLKIKHNCGSDNVCKPNLNMNIVSNQKQYILGSGHLIFNVSVHNIEEDSFGTVFRMKIPPGVSYSRFEDLSSRKTDVNVQCYPLKGDSNYIVTCNIGNPLPSNKEVRFRVFLEPLTSVEEAEFEFSANVTTKNPEISPQMRLQELHMIIPIVEETHLLINSESSSSQTIYYNASQYDDLDKIETDVQAGPYVRHEYTIKNLGPSDVLQAEVVFDWPSKTSNGNDLLYIINQPKTEGPITCERVPDVNYRKLQITRSFDDRYNEHDKIYTVQGSSLQHTNNMKFSGNANSNQINNKYEIKKGSSSYEQSQKSTNTYTSKGSGAFHENSSGQQNNVYNTHTSSYDQGGQWSVSGSGNQAFNTHYQGNSQTGQGSQWSAGGGGGQTSNTHVQGSSQSRDGHWSVSGGDSYQNNLGSGQKGATSVHESESSYHKSTVSKNGDVNSYEEGSWKTNDNGVMKNGSYSRGRPTSYDYNAVGGHENTKTYQGSGNTYREGASYGHTNTYEGSSGYSNVNAHREGGSNNNTVNTHHDTGHFFEGQDQSQNRGTIVNRQWIGDDILTRYNEETIRGPTQVVHRGTEETEDIYHNKSVNVKFVKPTELPDNFVVPKGWVTLLPETPQRRKKPPPLREDDEEEETGDGEGDDEGDEDDEYGESTSESEKNEESTKRRRSIRSRRDTTKETGVYDTEFCTPSTCQKISCTIGRLLKDGEASVIFPAVAWARTIRKFAINRPLEIGSRVVVNVTRLPHIKTPKNVTYTSEILTNVTSMDYVRTPPDVIPLWIVVASACLGTLILMLLVYLLYKSGFFKRNRPPHLPERQPLNRNGGFYADEAL